jgi:hypothetical protein
MWKANHDTPLRALPFSLIKATVKLGIIQQFLSKMKSHLKVSLSLSAFSLQILIGGDFRIINFKARKHSQKQVKIHQIKNRLGCFHLHPLLGLYTETTGGLLTLGRIFSPSIILKSPKFEKKTNVIKEISDRYTGSSWPLDNFSLRIISQD